VIVVVFAPDISPAKDEDPLKYIACFPFIADAVIDGDPKELVVLFANILLSFHVVTPGSVPISDELSAASNHNTHSGTDRGSNPEMLFVFLGGGISIVFKCIYLFTIDFKRS
jgi:hypothetical protein